MLTIANLFVPKRSLIPNTIQTASNIFLTQLPNPIYYNIQSASRVGYVVSIGLILYGLKNMISVSKSVLSEMPEKIGGVTYLRDDELRLSFFISIIVVFIHAKAFYFSIF